MGNQFGTTIPETASKATGDFKTEIGPGLPSLEPFAPPFNLNNLLKRRGCDADAVIIATIKNGDSFLTEDETFLYTNYNVTVDEVLKNNPASTIDSNDTVTVSRRGGMITLFGKKVYAVDKNGLPLQLNKRYLLFLTYLPERNAYVADNLTYLLENDKIVRPSIGPTPKEMESGNDATAFIKAVRAAVAEPCPTTQGGAQ